MSRVERLEKELGVSQEKAKLLADYWERMLEFNSHTNLTAITLEDEVLEKHFRDSAFGAKFLPGNGKVADVGSGGGFPALVLAILKPELEFTLIEATAKKAGFLADTAAALGLSNVTVVNERIEAFAKERGREKFDCVTARALAPLNTLLEYATPLLKIGGKLVAYKGKNAGPECTNAEKAGKVLGMAVKFKEAYFAGGERVIVGCEKVRETPKGYPRPYKKMKENPL